MPLSVCKPRFWISNILPTSRWVASAIDYVVWNRKRLQPSRQVWGVADDAALLCLARAGEIANNNHAGRNADTNLALLRRGRKLSHGLDQSEPCPHRSLAVLLMRLRVAEI